MLSKLSNALEVKIPAGLILKKLDIFETDFPVIKIEFSIEKIESHYEIVPEIELPEFFSSI